MTVYDNLLQECRNQTNVRDVKNGIIQILFDFIDKNIRIKKINTGQVTDSGFLGKQDALNANTFLGS